MLPYRCADVSRASLQSAALAGVEIARSRASCMLSYDYSAGRHCEQITGQQQRSTRITFRVELAEIIRVRHFSCNRINLGFQGAHADWPGVQGWRPTLAAARAGHLHSRWTMWESSTIAG